MGVIPEGVQKLVQPLPIGVIPEGVSNLVQHSNCSILTRLSRGAQIFVVAHEEYRMDGSF